MTKTSYSILLIVLVVVCFAIAFAATAGPSTPGNYTLEGGARPWIQPEEETPMADDGLYWTNSLAKNLTTDFFVMHTFGFSIPTSATINGITLQVEHKAATAARWADNTVQLVKTGTTGVGDNKASVTEWAATDETFTYGSTSTLWGTTWTPAEINATSFGVKFSAKRNATTGTVGCSVEWFKLTITYTEVTKTKKQVIGISG